MTEPHDGESMVIISAQLAQTILTYLVQHPYAQVFQMVAELRAAEALSPVTPVADRPKLVKGKGDVPNG